MNTRILFYSMAFGFCCLLSACDGDDYYFSKPLPVDVDNTYEFPKLFRGSWVDDDDTLRISKAKFVAAVGPIDQKIINGVWLDPVDTIRHPLSKQDSVLVRERKGKYRFYESTFSIKFDSVKKRMDTIQNFVMKGNFIYHIDAKELSPGSPFKIMNDTIRVKDVMAIGRRLGKDCFLRKVKTNQYVINFMKAKSEIGEFEDVYEYLDKAWWRPYLLQVTHDELLVLAIKESKIQELEIFYVGGNTYYDAQWKKIEFDQLILRGVFTDTVSHSKRIKL